MAGFRFWDSIVERYHPRGLTQIDIEMSQNHCAQPGAAGNDVDLSYGDRGAVVVKRTWHSMKASVNMNTGCQPGVRRSLPELELSTAWKARSTTARAIGGVPGLPSRRRCCKRRATGIQNHR